MKNTKKNKKSIDLDNLQINKKGRITCKIVNYFLVFVDVLYNQLYLIDTKIKKYTYYCFFDNINLALFIFNSDGQFIKKNDVIMNKLKETNNLILFEKEKELKKYNIGLVILKINLYSHILNKINFDYLKINPYNRIISKIENNYLIFVDTKINNQYIYKKDKDYKYYCLYDENVHELFIFDDKGKVIYKKNIIDKIKETEDLYTLYTHHKYLIVYGIKFIFLDFYKECSIFNKELLNPIIDKLNKSLIVKCPELLLKLDFGYKLDKNIKTLGPSLHSLILCLYYKEKCISNIVLIYKDNNILEIESFTEENMRNKKYNKLLRCIIIIIASYLKCQDNKIHYVLSRAVNPQSAWLLMDSFNFKVNYRPVNTPLIDYTIFKNIFYKKISKQKLFDLYEKTNEKLKAINDVLMLYIYIPIKDNLEIAYKMLNEELLNNKKKSITCP